MSDFTEEEKAEAKETVKQMNIDAVVVTMTLMHEKNDALTKKVDLLQNTIGTIQGQLASVIQQSNILQARMMGNGATVGATS